MRQLVIALTLCSVAALAAACETSTRPSDDSEPALAPTVVEAPVLAAVAPEPAAAAPGAEDKEEASCGGSCGGGESCGGDACGCEAAMATRAPRNVPADAVWTQVAVKGMRCGGCEKKLEAALANLDGVYDVDADHSSGSVRIATAPTARDVRARAVPQIEQLGFRAH